MEFDRQAQMRDFVDKQADYAKLADQVAEEQAKENSARAKDETELKTAEDNLRKAEFEMQKTEIVSRIDAEKNQENLDEAKATYEQLKETFDLKRKAAQAAIRILEIQRDRTQQTMLHAEANADLMQVRSPLDGVVVLNTIWKQGTMGEVQEGDQIRPGVPFMQVVNPATMQVRVMANQQDFPSLQVGQTAKVRLDAYPDLVFDAKLDQLAPIGEGGDFSSKLRSFVVIVSITGNDPKLMPDLSAAVDVDVSKTERQIEYRTSLREWFVMIRRFRQLSMQGKTIAIAILVLAGSGVLLGAVRLGKRTPTVPTIAVKRGEFLDLAAVSRRSQGAEVGHHQRAVGSRRSTDHQGFGGRSAVKFGDVVVEFDKTKTEQELAQNRSSLKSAEAGTDQARAQARLAEEEDTTTVLKARYAVESAKLEASKQEIVSKIEGEEAKLKLADAEQALREAETKQKSDQALNQATIESTEQASKKAKFDMQRAERALAQMSVRAPSAGTISLLQHWGATGPVTYRAGDRAWPGAAIAELPDATTLRISARVDETERGRLALKQAVTVQLNAIPDRQFTGHIEQIGALASMDFAGGWPFTRNFILEIVLDQTDARFKPGISGQVTVIVDRVPDALTIPAQAVFQKSGQNVAYVWRGTQFEERAIDVARRSGDNIMIAKGVSAGEQVALRDPTAKE